MKIQSKLIILVLAFIAAFLGVFAIERGIECERITLLLEEEKKGKESLFDTIVKLQGALTEMVSIDYSFWDDTVKFLETKDAEWAKINLETALDTYNINALWLYKKDLSSVYSINNIPGAQPKDLAFSPADISGMFAGSQLCHFFMKTEFGPMEIYGATIHPSNDVDRSTPPRGFFLAGKLWDVGYINSLMQSLGAAISLHLDADHPCPDSVDPVKASIFFPKVLSDWNGKPAAYLHVSSHSGYVKSFNKTSVWIAALFLIFSLVVFIALTLSLVFWISKPLALISEALKKQDANYLRRLRRTTTEFGEISRLISSFFTQREELRDREERLKQVSENAGEWIWEVDNEGLYTYSNAIVEKILGYTPEEIVGKKHFYDLFVPEKREELKKLAWEGFSSGKPFGGFINSNSHKNGNIVYLETNGTPILDSQGNFLGYRGADRDITERRIAEEKLLKSESQLANAVQMAHMGPWEYDVPRDLFTFNDYFYAIFKTTAREAGGYTMSSAEYARRFVHPEDRHMVEEETRKAIDTEDHNFSRQIEHRMLYANGEVGYIAVRFFIVKDDKGKTVRTFGVNQDITELKKTGEELRQNEKLLSEELERFKILFELTLSMSSGRNIEDNLQFIVDKIRDFLRVDISFITLLDKGHTRAHIHAESGIKLKAFKDLSIPAGKGLGGMVTQNRTGYIVEDYFTDKDIHHFADETVAAEGVISCMAAPIQSKDKDFGVLYAFHRSKRHFSQDELHTLELFAHLATVEMERAQAFQNLRDAQMQLVQTEKMAAIGQLASGVAHEINNPLTGVLNNVQLIKLEMEAKKEKFTQNELKELLDIVEESAYRCMKITHSLLSFSRASKGEFRRIDFNEMINHVIFLVEHEMKLGNVSIEKDLQDGVPPVSGDIQLLQQVVFNFISNAKWAIEKKSASHFGTIRIKTGYEADKSRVCVLISDDGIGMSQETLKKIFEPFFTTKPVGEGTGLGLSVAYSIIREHQGYIEVESTVNQGTTFKLCFPAIK